MYHSRNNIYNYVQQENVEGHQPQDMISVNDALNQHELNTNTQTDSDRSTYHDDKSCELQVGFENQEPGVVNNLHSGYWNVPASGIGEDKQHQIVKKCLAEMVSLKHNVFRAHLEMDSILDFEGKEFGRKSLSRTNHNSQNWQFGCTEQQPYPVDQSATPELLSFEQGSALSEGHTPRNSMVRIRFI